MKSASCVLRILLLAIAVLLGTGAGFAQTGMTAVTGGNEEQAPATVTLPKDLTPETVRELVSKLSDQQVRQLLLERLDAVARQDEAKPEPGRDVLAFLGSSFAAVGGLVVNAVTGLPEVFSGLKSASGEFADKRGAGGIFWTFAIMGVAMAVGFAAEMAVTRFASKWREQIENVQAPESLQETLEVLGKRLFLELVGLLAFFAVTRLMIQILAPENDRPLLPLLMVNLIVMPRLSIAITRFLFAPTRPKLRLVHTDDWTARFIFRHQLGVILLIGTANVIVGFQELQGISFSESSIGFWLVVISVCWLVYVLYRARHGLTSIILGSEDDATRGERLLAMAYPWLAIVMVLLTWLIIEMILAAGRVDLIDDGQGYITVCLFLLTPIFDTMVRGLVKHLVPPMRGEGVLAEAAYRSTKRSYIRIGRALLTAVVIVVIARVWDIDYSNLASAGLGVRIAASMFEILFILAAGYLVWEVVTLWLNRKLADERTAAGIDLESEEPGGGEGGGVGGTRMSTVLPLVKMVAQISIITITILIALGNMGVDITPLLAGAGIVGLAIGFGAQTLVKDIVSGLFFLVDDAFRVGEYLEIDGTVGTVEKISVRSLQLRHHQGPVHTIPYGEIPKITNNSRDWVIVKLKFTVPFDTDVNKVKKLFKQIGKDIMEAPYADDIIQTFKSQGVYDVNDVGIVVRGKFMAKPGKQWMIRKDVYARVQKIFAENGIEFARREVRVKMPETEDGAEAGDQNTAAAAAEAAIAQQEEEMQAAAKPT
ncbi:mechanosensitive ion channel family protein [Hoeflea prorocentri]|uniref:Mechanosensitive ion channel n=1 Tax=Hoeflea prorocentri TaxID=1922333 RepID=A0A9X3UIZ1_9HYPH|nr:mechanosensitive ion channel family protein [Hoeflea prorocentri]MCY6379536.1 mechanosensitive ion channel [Hoeflea prorocentri]MDA5397336.1 mechanosensitive ion channel [Hoeflea prorocentri]